VRSYCVSVWGVSFNVCVCVWGGSEKLLYEWDVRICVSVWGMRIYCVSVCFACTVTQEVNTKYLWGSQMEVAYTDKSSVAKFKYAFF